MLGTVSPATRCPRSRWGWSSVGCQRKRGGHWTPETGISRKTVCANRPCSAGCRGTLGVSLLPIVPAPENQPPDITVFTQQVLMKHPLCARTCAHSLCVSYIHSLRGRCPQKHTRNYRVEIWFHYVAAWKMQTKPE